jgi:hypothetical protein
MQPRTCILSTFALGMTLALGAAALAADLPKEGTFSGTFYGVGTYKASPVGKERLLLPSPRAGSAIDGCRLIVSK